jgi:hypothetical protein
MILIWFVLLIRTSGAQESTVQRDTAFIKNVNPQLNVVKVPAGSITVDGKINESQWVNAETADNFVEIEPGDNIKSEVRTEVKVLYDDDNIYFAFICYDENMSSLRASITDRDKIFSDDFVGFIMDTFEDNKRGYEIFFNPYGIQGDGIWTPNGESFDFDMVFDSEGKIYKDKWIVEAAIPFKNLRFPDKDIQEWKIHFIRTRAREARVQMSWAVISRDNSELLPQAGFLKGIKNVKSGKHLEILPYVIGSQNSSKSDINNPDSEFINETIKGDFGVGLKYGFTSNLTGELVYNPDFSQVEADATQIDVNTSSAIYYSEKRPFFLEGANIFESKINTVYTRMLNSPLFAAKLTGKIGNVDIGFLSVYDKKTPFLIPYDYGSELIVADSLKSVSNILRLKKSLKGESFIGFIATDREVDNGYNRVFGFDGKFNFLNNFYLSWQMMHTSTKEINKPDIYEESRTFGSKNKSLGFDGETFSGFTGMVSLDGRTRNWNFGINYSEAPPETRKDLGYTGSVNYRELAFWQYYVYYPVNSIIVNTYGNLNGGLRYNYEGKIKEQWLVPDIFIQFKKLINADIGVLAVNNELYEGVYHKNVHRGWFNFNINTSKYVYGGGYLEAGKYIVRFEEPSYVGAGFSGQLWLTLQPLKSLKIDNNFSYFELSKNWGGEKLFAGYIFRNKTSLQFTRNIFFRLVFQYDSFEKRFDIDPLFTYKWNPFTIFYIGSTHDITDYGSISGRGRFKETSRQFFAKFQYLFTL